jgi:dodecin
LVKIAVYADDFDRKYPIVFSTTVVILALCVTYSALRWSILKAPLGLTQIKKEVTMSVAKIIEISAGSTKSFEDAVQVGVSRASETIKNITSAWISEQKVVVEKGKVVEYRVTVRITFILDEPKPKSKK